MPTVKVDNSKCDGDGVCVDACPVNVFEMQNGKAVPVNASECIDCQACVEACPQKAIEVTS